MSVSLLFFCISPQRLTFLQEKLIHLVKMDKDWMTQAYSTLCTWLSVLKCVQHDCSSEYQKPAAGQHSLFTHPGHHGKTMVPEIGAAEPLFQDYTQNQHWKWSSIRNRVVLGLRFHYTEIWREWIDDLWKGLDRGGWSFIRSSIVYQHLNYYQ